MRQGDSSRDWTGQDTILLITSNVRILIDIGLVGKFLKIKAPLAVGLSLALAYDWTFHRYTEAPKGHWLLKNISNSIWILK